MHPKELQLGSVSRETERTMLLALLLLTVGLRVLAWRGLPLSATEIAGVARPWLPWAVAAQGLVTVLVLYRLLRNWLDLPSAVVAGAMWAAAGWAVAPPAEFWPEQLALPLLLMATASALGVVERRSAVGSWRLGAWLGAASVLTGTAWIWLLGLCLWLPSTSRRLRGLASLRLGAEVMTAALLVPAILALALSLTPWSYRVLPDTDRVLSGLSGETLSAPFTRHDGASQAALDAWVGFQMAEADLAGIDSPLQREAAVNTLIWSRALEHPVAHLGVALRRAGALVAAWPGLGSRALAVPVLPWAVAALAAWLGFLALIPSWRRYFPFLLGALAPLLQVALCGITVASLLLALPFLCVLAGYGLQRLAVGRASVATWLLGLAVLAAAFGAHRLVAAWA